MCFPVNIFYRLKNFFSKITFISIIILIFNMYHKLFVVLFRTFRNCFAILNPNFPLNSLPFDVI